MKNFDPDKPGFYKKIAIGAAVIVLIIAWAIAGICFLI